MPDHKDIAIAIFVKTPELSPIKTRLAAGIGKDNALHFYRLSCQAIAAAAQEFLNTRATGSSVFWAVAEHQGEHASCWQGLPIVSQGEGDLGHRLHTVYETLQCSFSSVLLIGADMPHIRGQHFEQAIAALAEHDFAIGPALDGGFYLFGGRQPILKNIWTSVSYSVSDTGARLSARLKDIGPVASLEPAFDVDTKAELQPLRILLHEAEHLNPELESLRNWLDDSQDAFQN